MKHVVVLGAGPAGLTAAYELCKQGYAVTVIEKEAQVGGISKTIEKNGYRFDLGGHRFYTKMPEVDAIWHEVLQDDFLKRPRLSRIYYRDKFFDYPIKAWNALSSLGLIESLRIIASYCAVRIKPIRPEDSFQDWVSNRFGVRLFQHFFKTYTEKVWGMPCTELKAEWAAQRIKGLDLTAAVINALFGSLRKNTIKTLIEEFHYPRLGPGMMYEAMAARIEEMGGVILYGCRVARFNREGGRVNSVTVVSSGEETDIPGDDFISSLPLRDIMNSLAPLPTGEIVQVGNGLKYRDFLCVNLALNQEKLFPDNWIYVHSPEVKLGRIQNFKQWSPDMVPEEHCCSLGLEYFCNEGDDLWVMDDEDLVKMAVSEAGKIGLVKADWVKWGTVVRVPKAYPVYDDEYKRALPLVKAYLERFENLQTIGRNGLHRYNNMDHSMLTGILAAQNVQGAGHDLWNVNTDEEYQEEMEMKQ